MIGTDNKEDMESNMTLIKFYFLIKITYQFPTSINIISPSIYILLDVIYYRLMYELWISAYQGIC